MCLSGKNLYIGNCNLHILVKTIDEFRGMNSKDVVSYIEWEPFISVVPVEPGLANIEKYHLNKYELHRLLSTLLLMKLTVDEKLGIIEKEYSIPVDDRIRENVSAMCNLSQGIRDNTLVDVIMNMHQNDFTLDQIAVATKKSVEEIKAIIEKIAPVLA
ncbi:MAG: hypothetical protein K2N85_13705 [Lachnospiraceae bacterium]|nr:hypothetical protein [Lachnospiraceae bacterium]